MLGYVPQKDIMHDELTVEQSLTYTAKLRIARDATRTEIKAAVAHAIEAVDLGGREKTMIANLSGGQKKRVSIAMELLASPRLLILDEPTSGLSPDLDRSMMELCRKLSHENCTVLMVTHNMSNINLCDKIAFLGTGGVLCYYGSPEAMDEYFDVELTSDTFEKLHDPEQVEYYRRKYFTSPEFNRLAARFPAGKTMQSVKIGKLLRQLAVLISRNFQLIWNQKLTLGSLILQAPLMVLVIKLVGEPDCFTSNLINIGSRTVLFIVCAMASFMGLLNSYREICKDREIIFREASVGVSLLATVLSKAITLFLVEAVQAGILTAGFVEIIHIPQNHLLLDTNVEIFITIFLLMAASSAMGLLVSASLKSSEAAVLLVRVLIIGQVVFSGVMFSMTGALTAISYIIVCRWGMGALGASTDLNDRLSWLKAGLDSPMYDATVPNLVHSWQMLGLITLVCVAAAWLVLYIGFNRKKG